MELEQRVQKQALLWIATGAFGAWAASWALAIPTPVQPQPTWTCEAARWDGNPEMRNNRAEGKMLVECTLSGASGSLGNLYDDWIGELKETHELVAEPTPATTEKLRGLSLALIEKVPDVGNGPLTIHKEAKVASDRRNRFVYTSQSKNIEGGGNSAFLKRINTTIEVTRVPGTRGRFRLVYSDQLAVERPWFAPDGIFLNEVARQSLHNFEIAREKLTTNILEGMQTRPPLVAFQDSK